MESRKHNITYLFGAGASYYAVPMVKEMPEAFEEFLQVLKEHEKEISQTNTELFKHYSTLIGRAKKLISEGGNFNTIDTYARKLVLNGNDNELRYLKVAIGYFFAFWQDWKNRKSYFSGDSRIDNSVSRKKEFIDHRYISLFANLLQREQNKIVIPANINFLTWNYDTQIERALNQFTNYNYLHEVFPHFGVIPQIESNFDSSESKVVHLNGIAGLYSFSDNGKYKPLANFDHKPISDDFHEFIRLQLGYEDQIKRNQLDTNEAMTFAWEDTPISQIARQDAIEIMKHTDVLVVIGYSFPLFNLDVDRALMESFKENNQQGKCIFYQDKQPNIEIIRDSFGFDSGKIIARADTDQFIIPRQYL